MDAATLDRTLRLAVWSGPRNLSTALMRSFENRADTRVVDEPLYSAYLTETGLPHPMREAVIASGDPDWRGVARSLLAPQPDGVRCLFQKHMAHHLLPSVGREWLARMEHVFLIRDPHAMLASLHAKYRDPVLADTGLPQQVELFERAADERGEAPPVIDADELLRDPRGVLEELCARVELAFDEAMLSWPPGPRASDGVWGEHWYASVRTSTGFGSPRARQSVRLPAHLEDLAERCAELHARLHPRRIRARV